MLCAICGWILSCLSFVCVSSIEVIAPDVALPYREPSFTAICGSSHLTRAYMCYRPCMFFSCVSCMSFSHFLIGFLSPPSSLRPSSASCPLSRMFPVCPVVSLLLFLSLPLSRYLELSFDVGLDGMASLAVFVPCSRYYLATGSPTCVAAAVGTWSSMMGAPFGCPHGRSPSRSPSRKKQSSINEQCAWAASNLSWSRG